MWPYPILAVLFRPFDLLLPNILQLFVFSNISILSVSDEGYYRNVSCALNLISTFFFIIRYGKTMKSSIMSCGPFPWKLYCACLFNLRLLITPLVASNYDWYSKRTLHCKTIKTRDYCLSAMVNIQVKWEMSIKY